MDKEMPLRSHLLLNKQYGGIYQLDFVGKEVIFVTNYEYSNEVSNEKRFMKNISVALLEVRKALGDGLFTAYNEEPNWGKAHRLLMPAFGPGAIRGMFEDMNDICSQMLLKWERYGRNTPISPSDDYTRLALDTICLCSTSHRLNSFYTKEPPEFAIAMSDFLIESMTRPMRLGVVQAFMTSSARKFDDDANTMLKLVDTVVNERKAHPSDKKDLLNFMLFGKDPQTGEGLDELNIKRNLLTFMIAGHETTSGTLSFATYYLLKNPDALAKLRAEVDSVLGDRPVRLEDLPKLIYTAAVLRETLRIAPPAPMRSVAPLEDTTIGNGKYAIKKGQLIGVQTWIMQRDPAVWGEDAEEFRPDRMLDGKFEALPNNAWQPFGFGLRGCIGRPFAWQEMLIVLSSVIQKFDLELVDPSYDLRLKATMTIKPDGLAIKASLRNGKHHIGRGISIESMASKARIADTHVTGDDANREYKQPIYVLYGSNSGSSEGFAQTIASDAPAHGFRAVIGTLDSAATHLPTDGPVIIITASYEGEPPDNAAQFVRWLTGLEGEELTGVSYAVFGCGNKDWVKTYQRIPTLCDDWIEKRGGKRFMPRGAGDAASAVFFEAFDAFEGDMWKALSETYDVSSHKVEAGLEVKTVKSGGARAEILRQTGTGLGSVVDNEVLTADGAPVKRHITFELPEDMTYQAGDYLAILPTNPQRDVRRVLARFGLSPEDEIIITAAGPTSLPVDNPVVVFNLLSGFVELSQPATTRDLRALVDATTDAETLAMLNDLIASHAEKVAGPRLSVLDILEQHPTVALPFAKYLTLLPAMRIRQYSISSSSLVDAHRATVTLSVVDVPALSGVPHRFLGVASNFLAELRAGDRVQISVRPAAKAFRLPNVPTAPVAMFCAGSGIAPMRGFIQERAAQKEAGRDVGRMILFYGCRAPGEDYLFSDSDLKHWTELGVVDVRPAFSRASDQSQGCKYVQDRIYHDRADVMSIWNEQGKFFSCGSGKVGHGIEEALVKIIKENNGCDDEVAREKFRAITKERYATDVFD